MLMSNGLRNLNDLACCAICGMTMLVIVALPFIVWEVVTGFQRLAYQYP